MEEVDYNKEYKIYKNALKLLKARGNERIQRRLRRALDGRGYSLA